MYQQNCEQSPIQQVQNKQYSAYSAQFTPGNTQIYTTKKMQQQSPVPQSLGNSITQDQLNQYKEAKAKELEKKVDLILEHNSMLLAEKDQLQKLYTQKKTESDIWKQKYESQMNQIISNKAIQENGQKAVLEENAALKAEIEKLSFHKNKESILQEQAQQQEFNGEIDYIKYSHSESVHLYEEQLRRIKAILDERDKENSELTFQLNNERQQNEVKANQQAVEKEELKNKILKQEQEIQHQLDCLKQQQENAAQEAIENLKNLHIQELEILNCELQKLKDLLNLKNNEIKDLIESQMKSKKNFKNDETQLKQELNNMKSKMLEINQNKNTEVQDVIEKMEMFHKSDVSSMKFNHNNQIHNLEGDIVNLQNLIKSKSQEIDQLNLQKLQIADKFQKDMQNQKIEGQNQELYLNDIINKHKQMIEQLNYQIQGNQCKSQELAQSQMNQIQFLEAELDKYKIMVTQKNNEIEQNIQHMNAFTQNVADDSRTLKQTIEHLKNELKRQEQHSESVINELQSKIYNGEQNNSNKYRELSSNFEFVENQNKILQDNLVTAKEQLEKSLCMQQRLDIEAKKLKLECDDLNRLILEIEKKKAMEIKTLRDKIESSNRDSILEIQSTHQNKLMMLQEENNDLLSKLQAKEEKIQELCNNYNKILSSNNSTDPNVKTYKNLYEVYTQSKNCQQ